MSSCRHVPEDFLIAFTLCADCAAELNAVRSDLWGWVYPRPEETDEDLQGETAVSPGDPSPPDRTGERKPAKSRKKASPRKDSTSARPGAGE
jgi:hypothetical protein